MNYEFYFRSSSFPSEDAMVWRLQRRLINPTFKASCHLPLVSKRGGARRTNYAGVKSRKNKIRKRILFFFIPNELMYCKKAVSLSKLLKMRSFDKAK
jgi:hypothetical protein